VTVVILLGLYFAAWLMNASPTHQLGGDETSALLRSGVARVEEWRLGLAVLALWATLIAHRRGLALLFAGAAVVVSGATGHSAAINPIVAAPSRALHLLAGAAWLGGVFWLLLVRDIDAAAFRAEARRVSEVALWAAVLVGISGAIQAFVFLPSLSALFTSPYGLVTLAKVAGLCVLVGFGAYHRSRSLPRLTAESHAIAGFPRALRAELVVMALVVLLGGWLAYISPPSSAAHSAAHTHS
jgi:putative copper export protein